MPYFGKDALILDLKGRIEFAGSFFCDLVGIEVNQAPGMSFFDSVYPGYLYGAHAYFGATAAIIARHGRSKRSQAAPFLVRLRKRDGTPVWTEIQAAPVQTSSGEVFAMTATVVLASGPEREQQKRRAKRRK